MANVLAYIELGGGQPTTASLHVLRQGRRIATRLGATLYAYLPCAAPPSYGDDDVVAWLSRLGADKVILSTGERLGLPPLHATHGPALLEACRRFPAHLVLLPPGRTGLELGPRLAVELNARLGLDAWLSVEATEGVCYFQPAYRASHRLLDRLDGSVQPVVLVLSAPLNAPPRGAQAAEEAEVLLLPPPTEATPLLHHDERRPLPGTSPATARLVLGGGGGLGDAADFDGLERLAAALGGVAVASATACDRGLAPPERQVGLRGRVIDATVYLAFGVSGSERHLAGLSPGTTIAAVNHDPDAPIFRFARYGLVADARTTIQALLAALDAKRTH